MITQDWAEDLVTAAYLGHTLIESYIRGDKIDPQILENYYKSMSSVITETTLRGATILGALQELSETLELDKLVDSRL